MMRAALALALALTSTGGMADEITGRRRRVFDSTPRSESTVSVSCCFALIRSCASRAAWPTARLALLGSSRPRPADACRPGAATCEVVGEPDPYGRVLGRCKINGTSLNEQYVRDGYALARPSETTDYVAAEAEAKGKKIGLWQGRFLAPSEFRMKASIFVERPWTPRPERWAAISLGLGEVAGVIRVKVGRRDRWEGKHDP